MPVADRRVPELARHREYASSVGKLNGSFVETGGELWACGACTKRAESRKYLRPLFREWFPGEGSRRYGAAL